MGILNLKLRKRHRIAAVQLGDLVNFYDIPEDPVLAVKDALDRIGREGWRVRERPENTRHSKRWSFTAPNIVWVKKGFWKQSRHEQAVTLYHELVHVKQWKRRGPLDFLKKFAGARWRWATEVPAYRQSIRVWLRLTKGYFNVDSYVEGWLWKFRKSYSLSRINKKDFKKETKRIWELEKIYER